MSDETSFQRLQHTVRRVDRWLYRDKPWWIWPAILVFLGVGATASSLVFYPSPYGDEWTYVFGTQFGDTCGMIKAVGQPCPQCGMTRAWTHGVRGNLVQAFWYNPGGLTLLLWLQAGAFVGAVRLLRRDPHAARIHHNVLAGWAMFWMVFLYMGPWLARILLNINPLPG